MHQITNYRMNIFFPLLFNMNKSPLSPAKLKMLNPGEVLPQLSVSFTLRIH